MKWLLGAIGAVALAVFTVWLTANYVPRLDVVHVDGVRLEIHKTGTAVYGDVRYDLFETRPEFTNSGLREGSVARCEVEPWGVYQSPKVEITHIDARPIPRGATEERLVQFRSLSPADPALVPNELPWSIGCWDSAGNRTGTLYTVYYPHGEKPAAANPPLPQAN